MTRLLRPLLRAQFGQPSGLLGEIAGRIMANTKSNTERTRWTLSLLDLGPSDRVLEIGFGPGIAIELASQMAPRGLIVGADHSDVMLRQASRRNRLAIREGRVQLYRSSAEDLPPFDQPFDKIFSINSIHFWTNPLQSIKQMRRHVQAGRRPRADDPAAVEERHRENTTPSGRSSSRSFSSQASPRRRLELRHIKPMDVACAIGSN